MQEFFFRETTQNQEANQCFIDRYQLWLGTQMEHLNTGLTEPGLIVRSTAAMKTELASNFAADYSNPLSRAVIFSGKSGPLHEEVFSAAYRIAEESSALPLTRPLIVTLDDWQNKQLYQKHNEAAININDSPDPLSVLIELGQMGYSLAIHEDHTRLGGKYTALIELWRQRLIEQIFEYSAPAFPAQFWVSDFRFGIRDDRYNRYWSGLSKLFSEREFLKLYGFLRIFDNNYGLIPRTNLAKFDESMDLLDIGLDKMRNALLL